MRRPRRFVVARALVKEMLPTLLLAAGVSTFLLLIRALFVLADLFIARNVELGNGRPAACCSACPTSWR